MSEENQKKLITWISLAIVSIGGFCLIFFLRARYDIVGYIDGIFPMGCLILAIAAFIFLGREGTFDILGYAFGSFFRSLNGRYSETKYKDFNEYKDVHEANRKVKKAYYLPYLIVGGGLLLVSIILLIISKTIA